MVVVHQELRQESRSLPTVWILKLGDYGWLHRALEAGGIYLSELATVRSLAVSPAGS